MHKKRPLQVFFERCGTPLETPPSLAMSPKPSFQLNPPPADLPVLLLRCLGTKRAAKKFRVPLETKKDPCRSFLRDAGLEPTTFSSGG